MALLHNQEAREAAFTHSHINCITEDRDSVFIRNAGTHLTHCDIIIQKSETGICGEATLSGILRRYFHPEDGDTMRLRNISTQL